MKLNRLNLLVSSLVVFSSFPSFASAAKDSKVAIDLAASTVQWTGKKVVVDSKHHGAIKLKSAALDMKKGQLSGGNFAIDMSSITNEDVTDATYNKKLVDHLKSDDFFNAPKFPTADLKITSITAIEKAAAGQPTHTIKGDLTIKGKTNPIEFPATVTNKDGKFEATAAIEIDRTVWDIKYGSGKFFTNLGDKVIADKFNLDVKLVGKVQK